MTIVYGEDESTDASQPCTSTQGSCDDILEFPENGWEDICKATPCSPFECGMRHIVAYLVTQSVTDENVQFSTLTSQPRICLSVAMSRTFNVLKSTRSFTSKPNVS